MPGNSIHITGRGGSVSIFSGSVGTVVINGKVVSGSEFGSPSTRLARILITAPEGSDLHAELSQTAELVSLITHDSSDLDLSGQSRAALATNSLNADVSGQSHIRTIIKNGKFSADVSGQSRISAQGVFAKVHAVVSGQSQLETEGQVEGNYHAEASGMSGITHRGQVFGSVKRDCDRMSRISIG